MKTKHIFKLLASIFFAAVFLNSCGNSPTVSNNSITQVKSSGTEVSGDLEDYVTVVDGDYKITTVSLGDGKNELWLTVKLKVNQALEEGTEFGDIRATLLDEGDMTIVGLGQFVMTRAMSSKTDISKVDEALKKGSGDVTVQLKYLESGAANYEAAVKIIKDSAKKFSITTTNM